MRDQQISVLRFRATTVPGPNQFLKEYDEREDTDVFLRLQRLTSEEILLDHTTPLSEVVEIWDPTIESYTKSLVQYDCAGGLCLIQDGSQFNLKAEPEPAASAEIQCINGTVTKHYDMVTVKLRYPGKDVVLELCMNEFPWEQPRQEIREVRFKGYPKARIPSEDEVHNMPKLLLGTRAALLLPESLPEDSVPPAFRRKWPGLAVFKSRLTGRLVFAGMLPRREGTHAAAPKADSLSPCWHLKPMQR